MSHCSCEKGASLAQVFELQTINELSARGTQRAAAVADAEQRIIIVENRLLLATGPADGKKGCIDFNLFHSVKASLCWEFKRFDIGQEVNVEIELTATVAGLPVFKGTLKIHCDNVLQPQGCKISFSPGADFAANASLKGVDWKCLVACAPGCLSCGTNYWCWITCALPCILKCLL